MNNSLPTAQLTTLTDLLWPRAAVRGAVLLTGDKEGSVCRLPALFGLHRSGRVRPAPAFPTLQYLLHRGSTPKYTRAHSGVQAEAQGKYMEQKHTRTHICRKRMHALSSTRAPYCALERPDSTRGRSISPHPSPPHGNSLSVNN